jgi:hypothetical protein
MHDFIRKLWDSKATIAVILWIAVFAWAYNLDWVKKPIVQHKPVRKTVEEIIATPVRLFRAQRILQLSRHVMLLDTVEPVKDLTESNKYLMKFRLER